MLLLVSEMETDVLKNQPNFMAPHEIQFRVMLLAHVIGKKFFLLVLETNSFR